MDDDASYKLLFSAPELVRDLILGFIPDEWLRSLDYSTLERISASYVTDDLRHRADDVIWRVRAGESGSTSTSSSNSKAPSTASWPCAS